MTRTAAIVTIGTELTEGLRVDTNTSEIAHALSSAGIEVHEAVSVGDDEVLLAATISRLAGAYRFVVVTGGLGPTHDDVTREAASAALSRPLHLDERLAERLQPAASMQGSAAGSAQVLRQAMVLEGATVIDATTGTAPGQIVPTEQGFVALLPGPPKEMRGMLAAVLERAGVRGRAKARELAVALVPESDAQLAAQRVLDGRDDVRLTVLARPGDVRVLLLDHGAGDEVLDELVARIAQELGDACYTVTGESLPEAVVREASSRGVWIATAESCTGGMVAAALTDVPGSSAVFKGSIVSYSDEVKRSILGVDSTALAESGAVSAEVVAQMAEGVHARLEADVVVSVSGIAGPGGGSADKPVGTVWFGLLSSGPLRVPENAHSLEVLRTFRGDRDAVRLRATTFALDLLRRAICELPIR